MNCFLAIISLVILFFYLTPAENRRVTSDGLVYSGFQAASFHRITTHLIRTHVVNKLGTCAFRCSKNVECLSFNFGNPVNGNHVCELLRTDKYSSRSSYVNSTDFHHFFFWNRCEDQSPCQNQGLCYPVYETQDHYCMSCALGYTGKSCEVPAPFVWEEHKADTCSLSNSQLLSNGIKNEDACKQLCKQDCHAVIWRSNLMFGCFQCFDPSRKYFKMDFYETMFIKVYQY